MQPFARLFAIGIFAVTELAGALGARATPLHWDFSISLDNGDTASGEFRTERTPVGGPYLIVSLTGKIDNELMSLLTPDGLFNDNLLHTTQPFFDDVGLGFEEGGVEWAVWSASGVVVDTWCNNSATRADHFCGSPPDPAGAVTSMSLSLVPEPGTLGLLSFSVIATCLSALLGPDLRRGERDPRS